MTSVATFMQSVNVHHDRAKPMIQSDTQTPLRNTSWQRQLATAIRTPEELCDLLDLHQDTLPQSKTPTRSFPFLVTRSFVSRIHKGDPHDPLLLQILPRDLEDKKTEGFTADPLQENDHVTAPGLIQKYAGRALLMLTSACAINCRYCFRRAFPYADNGVQTSKLNEALHEISRTKSIHEIILSGGDPLLVSDERLQSVLQQLSTFPHLRRLRIHTRLPVVLPERVTDTLITMLATTRLATTIVIHANHAQELDDTVEKAMHKLRHSHSILLNQSVLLRGINDSSDALATLSERLIEIGVIPYYLHLLDRVSGTSHFEVDKQTAKKIHTALQNRLPGYAVPRLAQEVPGAPAKHWIG